MDTAIADRNAALTTFNAAQTNYQTAYANLVNGAGRYAIYDSSNNVVGYRCTTGCMLGDADISSAFNSAMGGLFGFPGNASPNTDATYLKPFKLQKELDALNTKLTAADKRVTDAQTQVDQVQQMVNNPAGCNTSGSAVIPMTPDQAEDILIEVDRKGGVR